VKLYWKPFFNDRLLGEMTRKDIDRFVDSMDEKPLASATKNRAIKAGTIALRWAYGKEMIESDITRGITLYSGEVKERQILTPELAAEVFRVEWEDVRSRLANMLAMVTGLRQGKIMALKVKDLGKDCLYIRHSWNRLDLLKTPKNNEIRDVECPFPGLIKELLELAARNPWGKSLDNFVFWSERKSDRPMKGCQFLKGLRQALVKSGMSNAVVKDYTFHGWRHYFTSYMREKVNEKILQRQTGHKTLVMLNHYSEHKIAGDRERLREAQIAVFRNLLPEPLTEAVI
jgi:integrase